MMSRYLCTCQSYIELQNYPSSASQTLSEKLTSCLPQFIFLKTLRSRRHFILTLTSFTALSLNILTISLSSLFIPSDRIQAQDQSYSTGYEVELRAAYNATRTFIIPNVWQDTPTSYLINSVLTEQATLPLWTTKTQFFVPAEIAAPSVNNASTIQISTAGYQATLDCETMPINQTHFTSISQLGTDSLSMICDGLGNANIAKGVIASGEYLATSIAWGSRFGNRCNSSVEFGWVRANTSSVLSCASNGTCSCATESWALTRSPCTPRIMAYPFNVTISPTAEILNATRLSPDGIPQSLPLGFSDLDCLETWADYGGTTSEPNGYANFHSDSKPSAGDWITRIMLLLNHNDSSFLDPELPPPDPSSMMTVLSEAWALLNAVFLGQYYDSLSLLARSQQPRILPGRVFYTEPRVRISRPMFILTMAILSFNLFTGIIFFVYVRRNRLPWFPNSIASTLAYFAWSEAAMMDVQRTAHMSTKERDAFLTARSGKYRLGRKVAGSGKGEIVIDRAEGVEGFKKKGMKKTK